MSVDPNLLTPFKNTGQSSLRQISEDAFYVVNEVVMKRLGHVPIHKLGLIFSASIFAVCKFPQDNCCSQDLSEQIIDGIFTSYFMVKKSGLDCLCQGDFHLLPPKVQRFVAEKAELMRPRGIYICDGSQHEADEIIDKLVERGMLSPLKAYENNYICRTDPKDVARVESKTWMVTPDKYQTVTHTSEGVEPIMGHWLSPDDLSNELDSRFPGCMAGWYMRG
uniref:PEPCK_N domain-containing protein n=1 Tax=Heterorhabditis bacteriophora TaxID=37862 RepID=A0A1I7WNG2_HETBA